MTDDGPIDAGWYVRVDDTSYSGPFGTEAEALRAHEMILRGDVDEIPLREAWPK